jgi:hypothetical protein
MNKVCHYLSKTTTMHWEGLKKIFCFIRGTVGIVLHIQRSPHTLFSVFTGADWMGCDRRSTSGFVVFFGSNIVSWSARKQPTVSCTSTELEYKVLVNGLSTEEEYKALANGAAEVTCVLSLLGELHVVQPHAAPVFRTRSQHIEVDFHFAREKVALGALEVRLVPSVDQIADVFTKMVTMQMLERYRRNLNLVPSG